MEERAAQIDPSSRAKRVVVPAISLLPAMPSGDLDRAVVLFGELAQEYPDNALIRYSVGVAICCAAIWTMPAAILNA